MVKRVRYFLNENYKFGDSLFLESYPVSRDKEGKNALIKPTWIKPLERYVRTKQNPKGILDWELIDITKKENNVLESSLDLFKLPLENYTYDKLMGKQRHEIVKIAKSLGIPEANIKSDEFLRRKILELSPVLSQQQEDTSKSKVKSKSNSLEEISSITDKSSEEKSLKDEISSDNK
jgi:hypothetical protein